MKKLLAFILSITAVLSLVRLEATADGLAENLLRLHVLAASDSEDDQSRKLLARDAVLDYLTPLLEGCGSLAEAREIAEAGLQTIAQAAADASGQTTAVSLSRESYPRRDYGGVALPAGSYLSLRIELESGAGRNWWCVVFPPLCAALSEDEEAAFALFDEEEAELISGSGREIKFRILEWLDRIFNLDLT